MDGIRSVRGLAEAVDVAVDRVGVDAARAGQSLGQGLQRRGTPQ
jgi:hypothetical protein